MGSTRPYDRPSAVSAEKGEVQVDGPDGIAVSLTPDAAEETARRLIVAAAEARIQLQSASAVDL